MYRIICNWCKLTKINFSVITEIFLICTYIFDFCKIFTAINDFYKLTFKSQWKFVDNWCIYIFTLRCSKACFLHLICFFICRNNSHIIAGNQMFKICHPYCKSLIFYNIVCCLMGRQVYNNLICTYNSAPCCVHCICLSIFIIGSQNHNRLWI